MDGGHISLSILKAGALASGEIAGNLTVG